MNSTSFGAIPGLLAGLPVAVGGALGGAPWWAVGVIVGATYLAVPLTGMILDHIRQRKGDLVDEKFAATLEEIPDPEKRIQAIILYRQAAATPAPQSPPEPLPGSTSAPPESGQATVLRPEQP